MPNNTAALTAARPGHVLDLDLAQRGLPVGVTRVTVTDVGPDFRAVRVIPGDDARILTRTPDGTWETHDGTSTATVTTATYMITGHPYSRHSRRPWECRICRRTPQEHTDHEDPSDRNVRDPRL